MPLLKRISLWTLLIGGLAGALALALSVGRQAAADDVPETAITIGTGGSTGVYYPAGVRICRLVNRHRDEHGVRCTVESTGGSVYNLNALRVGDLEFGIAQSDWQHHALEGTEMFEAQGPFEGLRSVFSLHSEPFTVLARSDSGIQTFADLKGKRVNVGNPGSGARATLEIVMKELGWSLSDFSLVSELKATEQSSALCDNKVDAIVFMVGHPSASIQEATTMCETHLVAVDGPDIDALIKQYRFYGPAVIPGGMYANNPDDVPTFGVAATLVTRADVPDHVVRAVISSVFENFESFKKQHPSFARLNKKAMIRNNLSAPLHPGAAAYLKEIGLR